MLQSPPKGDKVYVANVLDANVSVIDTASAAVITTIPVGLGPVGVAVTPDSKRVYVSNSFGDNTTVSKIDATTDTVVATIETGGNLLAATASPMASRSRRTVAKSTLRLKMAKTSWSSMLRLTAYRRSTSVPLRVGSRSHQTAAGFMFRKTT